MADYELVLAMGVVVSIIIGWSKFIYLDKITKNKNKILEKTNTDISNLLENHKELVKKGKKDFILDLVGLATLERRINQSEGDLGDIFFGLAGLVILSLIYSIIGPSVLIIVILIGEIPLLWAFMSLIHLMGTTKMINKYEEGIPPRELVKGKLKI